MGVAVALGTPWAIAAGIGVVLLFWGGNVAGWRLITTITDILQAFVATAIGVHRSINGTVVGTWEPAGSVRINSGEFRQ
jgi:hypothetical protein